MRLNERTYTSLTTVRHPAAVFMVAIFLAGACLLSFSSSAHAQVCATNGDCNDSVSCTTDTCVGLLCDFADNCGAGTACNHGADACQSNAGDPDNDGLSDAADPCPFDARNACYGMVALDPFTARPLRINANTSSTLECAGDKVDCNGDLWIADQDFNDPLKANVCNLNGGAEACSITGITTLFGCEDETTEDIFQCDHSDTNPAPNLIYDFDVADGTYLVNVFFANTFTDTSGIGDRVFDIMFEGVTVYNDFDQVAAAGGSGIAVVRSAVVTVSDSNGLTVEFGRESNSPSVKAFEILGADAGTCTTSVTCPTHTTCNPVNGLCEMDSGFTKETVASGLVKPTSLEFLPDGRILVLEKRGKIYIYDASTVPATQSIFLDIPDVLDTSEAGLLDITLDPDYTTNGYFYVFYAHDSNNTHRISRYTSLGSTADPLSELMLWEDDEAFGNCCHYGGGLDFGPDGKLYMSLGEKYDPVKAQDLTLAAGSVIRINKNGTIPIDNVANDNQCSVSLTACNADIDCPGVETCVLGPNNDAIWAYGFRNPFRAYWDDATGRYFIADLGFNTFETINLGQAGGNYGWPNCELNCGDPGTFIDPIFHQRHVGGGFGIVGGHVYHGTQFPTGYQNAYFYGDYAALFIRYLTFDATGTIVTGKYEFEKNAGSVVALEFSPDGSLYWLDYAAGELKRKVFEAGNQAPTITSATATPDNGAATLSVAFSATANDTETDPLTYRWIFGDGTPDAFGASVPHDYTVNGVYNAQVIVSDPTHDVASDIIEIAVGVAPQASIDAPTSGCTFEAGEMIAYSGSVIDDEVLDGTHFEWSIELIHADHSHPRLGPISGTSGSYTAPNNGHPYGDGAFLRIELKVTDSDGLSDTVTRDCNPDLVNLTFDTVPAGLQVLIDGIFETAPSIFEEAKGYVYTIDTISPQCSADVEQTFSSWSDSGAMQHQITVPTVDTSYTATFAASGVCAPTGDPDNDGLPGATDPCPFETRNTCFGGVATDQTTLTPIRVNTYVGAAECGGGKTDCNGDVWFTDFGYNTAASASVCDLGGGGELCTITGITSLFGCEDESTEDLFQCDHFDKAAAPNLTYDFDVPNGEYLINLFFANTFSGTSLPGDRAFDILAEGILQYDEFDQINEAGATGRAVLRAIRVDVSDGNGLQIEFQHGAAENPTVKALELLVSPTPPCVTNGDCDDTLFCNGAEICNAGLCEAGPDPCPGQMCDEVGDVCADCLVDGDCDDSNSCTIDTCSAGSCVNTPDTGAACDDSEACTITDQCNGSGACTGTPDTGAPCDDGSLCTTDDTCNAGGTCDAGTPVNCTGLDDICNVGTCDLLDGSCFADPLADGTDCDSGEFCDGAETCQAGTCAAGADPCVGQSCDEIGDACIPCTTNGDCSDGISCTDDLCSAGGACSNPDSCPLFEACNSGLDMCETVAGDPDNDGLSDGNDPCPNDPRNLCYGPVAQDQTTATDIRINAHAEGAEHCSGTRTDCNGDVWASDFGYNRANDNFECNLGGGDELCVITGISDIFGCDSDDTEDIFQCEHFDKAASAEELIYDFDVPNGEYLINFFLGNIFTGTDLVGERTFDIAIESALAYDDLDQVAAAGGSGIAVVRSAIVTVLDSNGLQIEFIHEVNDPAIKAIEILAAPIPPCATNGDCDDTVFCNGAEQCVATVCLPGSDPCPGQMCDEVGDVCADCLVDGDCDDANSCTIDTCSAGTCQNTADTGASCDDGEGCTITDQCNASGICEGTPDVGTGCDDGDLCTTTDMCSAAGACEGTTTNCSGLDDVCNDGMCDMLTGSCIAVPKADGTDCETGDFCDGAETCQAGTCSAGSDPCVGQSCDELNDVCIPCTSNGDCVDGISCTDDLCSGGACSNPDNCPLFEACNSGIDMCETVAGDPDNDGLSDGNDPCPNDPRNLCYGPVAQDQTTVTDIRINAHAQTAHCSGPRTDCNGDVWAADFGYNLATDNFECDLGGGGELCVISGISTIFGCDSADTEDLFQCEHFDKAASIDELIYNFDVPNGEYLINFFFANTFTGTDLVGERVFDIAIESAVAISNFDQVAAAGGSGVAVVRSAIITVLDSDGLQIEFLHNLADPAIKAIEVLAGAPGTTTTTSTTSTTMPECLSNADCLDLDFCNGAETCVGNMCQPGADPCPGQACDETNDICVDCLQHSDCADGDFCNGAEACVAGSCQAGSDPCPGQVCDEVGDTCADCFIDGDCADALFCNGAETCVTGVCQTGSDPCTATEACDEVGDTCDTCGEVSVANSVQCFTNRACTIPINLATNGLAIADVDSTVTATSSIQCGDTCTTGAAATNGTCSLDDVTCAFDVSDNDAPIDAFGDGEIAELTIECTQEAASQQLCLSGSTLALTDTSAAPNCSEGCVDFDCDTCLSGDCNNNDMLDASDPLCTVLCTIGQEPAGADCACAADCNCLSGVEASDPICAVLRQLSLFSPDTCNGGGGAFVASNGFGASTVASGDVRVRLSAPRIGDNGRATYGLSLRGDGAAGVAGIQVDFSSSGRVGRVKLAGKLRKRGFSLQLSRPTKNAARAFIMPPFSATGAGAIGRGLALRVKLPNADQTVTLESVELGSTTGTPVKAAGITRGVSHRASGTAAAE